MDKKEEADTVSTLWQMAAESLNPGDFDDLEAILKTLCKTRRIDCNLVNGE